MENPWTAGHPRVTISRPTHGWERHGAWVNEGPVAITRNGTIHLIFSASLTETPWYCLGRLTCRNGNVLDPNSWEKHPEPVYQRVDHKGVFGPGHCSLTTTPSGEHWLVHHAKHSTNHTTSDRQTHIKQFHWNGDVPVFGEPVRPGKEIPVPGSSGGSDGGGSDGGDTGGSATVAEGTYRIMNVNSGKCLDVRRVSEENGATLHQWGYGGGANQHWEVDHLGDGRYRLVATHSGKVADVAGYSEDNGGDIHQWDWHGGANQQWRIEDLGGGEYRIRSVHSGKVLDVEQFSKDNGANVHQWDWHGGDNQRWRFEQV
jgi:hypothetical protein